jgi:GTPase Era involved in 16S rRNA processing
MRNGEAFELIDGENLEFKGLFIKEVVRQSAEEKVIVVAVIGPQSSGKSTLMNYAFGTQFFTASGRCTSGIYFTLQRFPSHMKNKAGVKWLLMLDTEGLQSPERSDDEYDRKIVLFAMLAADVLIINSKGEINLKMINTLQICCQSYDMVRNHGKAPTILYSFG